MAEYGPNYVVFHDECTPHVLGKGDCSRASTGDGMKKQQLQEEWLQDAAFQLTSGETEGSGSDAVTLKMRRNVHLLPEQKLPSWVQNRCIY